MEQRWQAMLQLHQSDQQFYCLRCLLYKKFDSSGSGDIGVIFEEMDNSTDLLNIS